MADAKIRLSVDGAAIAKSEIDRVNASLGGLGGGADIAKTALAGLAGTITAGAFIGMIRGSIDAADKLNDLSKSTGLAIETLSGLKLASKQSGADLDGTAASINKLSVNIGKNAEKFAALGVTAKDPLEAFKQLSDVFKNINDPQLRAAVGAEALGKSWASAAPLLMAGSQEIQQMVDKGAKLSGVNQEMAEAADAFNDKLAELTGTGGLMNGMTAQLLPLLNLLADDLIDMRDKAGAASSSFSALTETFRAVIVFGGNVSYVLKTIGRDLGGVAAGYAAFFSGDFAGTKSIGQMMKADGEAARKEFDAWESKVMAAQTRAKSLRMGLDDPRVVKPDNTAGNAAARAFVTTPKDDKATTEKISEYTRMAEAISKVNTQAVQELANGGKLAASDKFQVEEMQKITFAFATHKISQQERIKLTEQTALAAAKMLEVERQAAGIKANQSNYAEQVEFAKELGDAEVTLSRAREQGRAVLADYAQAIDLDNRLTAFEITLIGKTESAKLKALELYRIEIELKKQLAAIDGNAGFDQSQRTDAYAAANAAAEQAKAGVDLKAQKIKLSLELTGYDATAAQLESLANITGKMGDGWKKATAGLSGFSNAFKNLATLEKNTALSADERTQAQVGGYAEMAGAAKQFFDEGTAGYEILTVAEQGFRAVELAMSVAAMVQKATETTAGIAQNVAGTGPALIKGAAEMFAQSGWAGFVGVAAMIALIAGMGGSSSGGGGGSGAGAGGGIGGNGTYAGSGNEITSTGRVTSSMGSRPSGTDGESSAAQSDREAIEQSYLAADAANKLADSLRKSTEGMTQLESDLQDVKTATQGAGRAQYELATSGMGGAELAAYNYNAALTGQIQVLLDVANGTSNASDNMKKLANDAVNLTIDLKRAQGDTAGANNDQMLLDTVGYSEQEIAVYNHNQSLKEQIASYSASSSAADDARQAEEELASKRYELAGRLNILLGRQTQIQIDRASELAGVTDDASLGMLNLIFQLEDYNTVIDASYAKLERSVAAEKKLADVRLKSASDLASILKATSNAINPSLDRASAQSQIAMYVALAKAGGVLPSAAALKPALDSIAKPSMDLFKTFSEYAVDQARTANDIADLSEFADKQVTEAQQTIDRLDLQLETAKQALDVLRGVDNSVMGVSDAVKAFEQSMIAMSNAQAGATAYSYAAPVASSGGGGGGGGGYGGGAAGDTVYAAAIAGMDSDIVLAYKAYYGRAPDREGHDALIKSGLIGDPLMQAILRASTADRYGADYAYAMSKGYNPDDPIANYVRSKKKASNGSALTDYGYNSFAVGINEVPFDTRALVHKGEEITPRPYVDIQRASRDETNQLMARLVASNERLEAKFGRLEAHLKDIKTDGEKTARTLDRVTRGGDAMVTTT